MEIKIDGDSRLLLGVTLISYQGAVTRNPPSEYLLAVQAPKILKVDTSVFQDRILDEPYDLKLYRKDNAYFVVLSDDVHPSVCYRVGRMGFFISKSKICGFGFFDLTDDELQMLDDVGLGLEKGI
jgi:hypothetical protein